MPPSATAGLLLGASGRRRLVAALTVLALLPAFAPAGVADGGVRAELVLQPCVAGGGRCEAAPVSTSDGRIFVQLFPAYVGSAVIFVEGDHGPRKAAFACDSPPATDCTRMLDMGKPGVYIVSLDFDPGARGVALLEAVTPS